MHFMRIPRENGKTDACVWVGACPAVETGPTHYYARICQCQRKLLFLTRLRPCKNDCDCYALKNIGL